MLAVCLILTLAACKNEDKTDEPLTGIYVIVDVADDPDGITFAELDGMYREMELDIQDFVYFSFYEDEWFKLVMFGDTEAEGTYTRDGNTLSLAADGANNTDGVDGTMTTEISGNRITWTYENGAKLIFEKK